MNEDTKFKTPRGIFIASLILLSAGAAFGQAAAGYSEYFLPGDEQNMYFIFNDLDVNAGATGMHSVTSVVAWSAIRIAKQATVDINVRRSWILFGDPSMKLTK
jgi:hypothetical protein